MNFSNNEVSKNYLVMEEIGRYSHFHSQSECPLTHAEIDFSADSFQEEEMCDVVLNEALEAHMYNKARARYNRRANRTHSRDHAHTRKAQMWKHRERMYLSGNSSEKIEKAVMLEYNAPFSAEVFQFDSDETELAFKCLKKQRSIAVEPWLNNALVLYLFDEAAAYIVRTEKLHEDKVFEIESIRTAFLYGKCAFSKTPLLDESELTSENFLELLLGNDVYALLQKHRSYRNLVGIVAHNLYALYKNPELHLYYLERVENK